MTTMYIVRAKGQGWVGDSRAFHTGGLASKGAVAVRATGYDATLDTIELTKQGKREQLAAIFNHDTAVGTVKKTKLFPANKEAAKKVAKAAAALAAQPAAE